MGTRFVQLFHSFLPARDSAANIHAQGMVKTSSLIVRIYENLEELQGLVLQWEDLLASIPAASIFNTWEYLAPWWRAFGAGRRLIVLALYDRLSLLQGLAPLALSLRRIAGMNLRVLQLMGDGNYSDNLDILSRPGSEAKVAAALSQFLQKQTLPWDICELNTLPSESPCAKALLHQLEMGRWPRLTHSRPSSKILLPESWEVYRRTVSANERQKIVRFSRRLEEKYSVRFFRCANEGELNACLEHLFCLHQKRWELRGQPGSFRAPACKNFFKELSRALLNRGQLDFWRLELNGTTVAALFGMRYRDAVYALQGGFDPDYSADSVGYVLTAHILREMTATGIRRFDFLAGSGPAKTRWGAQTVNYWDIHFSRPYSLGAVYLRAVECARCSKEWLRNSLPGPAWNLLRRIHVALQRIQPPKALGRGPKNLAIPQSRGSCPQERVRV